MKPARTASPAPVTTGGARPEVLSELRVSGHLMRLDPGLFCIVHMPTPGADPASGLPGIRLSRAPGPSARADGVHISGLNDDGWLSGTGDAALVRVTGGAAQILVTIYQGPDGQDVGVPNLQVRRVFDAADIAAPPAAPVAAVPVAIPASARVMDMVAHIQERGDVGARLGDWVGERGSKRWIEGFAIAPVSGIAHGDIEYQAVLGPGWLSPWVEGGQFCGSRGMALPVLGLRVRLRGAAAATHDIRYAASFVDGSVAGPVSDGAPCETENLSALESLRVELLPRAASAKPAKSPKAAEAPKAAARALPAKLAAKPAAKPLPRRKAESAKH